MEQQLSNWAKIRKEPPTPSSPSPHHLFGFSITRRGAEKIAPRNTKITNSSQPGGASFAHRNLSFLGSLKPQTLEGTDGWISVPCSYQPLRSNQRLCFENIQIKMPMIYAMFRIRISVCHHASWFARCLGASRIRSGNTFTLRCLATSGDIPLLGALSLIRAFGSFQ